MTLPRINLAQRAGVAWLALFLVAGCSDSHGREDDAGLLGADVLLARDAPPPGLDAPRPDAPLPVECAPEDAAIAYCVPGCDGPPRFHWDGERCFMVGCGECVGEDCGGGFGSLEACSAAHASCVPQLCRDTGGDWLFWAEECEHRRCGQPGPVLCEVGMPVCDCGPHRVFVHGEGCVDTGECELTEPLTRQALCTSTGGTWEGVCCDSVCGEPCALACASPACTCGPMQIFDDERGCIDAVRCFDRRAGESCGDPRQRCDAGQVCCDSCGGPGCPVGGLPRCTAVVCDGSPDFCGEGDFGG